MLYLLPFPRYDQSSVKNAHFSYTPPFKPKFENVPYELHPIKFVCRQPRQRANYWCKKFSPKTYPLAKVHTLRTDGRTYSIAVARQNKLNEYFKSRNIATKQTFT